MKFQDQDVVEIKVGKSRAVLDALRGRLLFWEHAGKQVIHWPDQADWSKPTKIRGGNPILFPFIARHMVNGEIGFWKDEAGVVREMPVHGFGRQSLYQHESSTDTCVLTLRDSPETLACYPYSFTFQLTYTVTEQGLRVTLRTKNTGTGSQALPYYSGHHFYFSIPHSERPDWELALDSKKQVMQEPSGAIIPQSPSSTPFKLSDPTLLDSMHLLSTDSIQGPVFLRHRPSGKSLAMHLQHPQSLPWYAVTTWTEQENSDFYCIEPWLGLPNAIHHKLGLRHLAPGQEEQATCLLEVHQW
jgi:galactose mutarotase-like enzyme